MNDTYISVNINDNHFTIEGYIAKTINERFYNLPPSQTTGRIAFRAGSAQKNIPSKYLVVRCISSSNWGASRSYDVQIGGLSPDPVPKATINRAFKKEDVYSFNFYGFKSAEAENLIAWLYDIDTINATNLSFEPPSNGMTDLSEYQEFGATAQQSILHYHIDVRCFYSIMYLGNEKQSTAVKEVAVNI